MEFQKDKLQKWLDDLIKGFELMATPYCENNSIKGIEHWKDDKRIHISGFAYDYIPTMASILGVIYEENDKGEIEWPLERNFKYKGYTFFAQIQRDIADDTEEI